MSLRIKQMLVIVGLIAYISNKDSYRNPAL